MKRTRGSNGPTPERIARFYAERKRQERELLRIVTEWAGLHEECPRAGCRRNRRCLDMDTCRARSDEPFSEEDAEKVRDFFAELARRSGRTLYDGTER